MRRDGTSGHATLDGQMHQLLVAVIQRAANVAPLDEPPPHDTAIGTSAREPEHMPELERATGLFDDEGLPNRSRLEDEPSVGAHELCARDGRIEGRPLIWPLLDLARKELDREPNTAHTDPSLAHLVDTERHRRMLSRAWAISPRGGGS